MRYLQVNFEDCAFNIPEPPRNFEFLGVPHSTAFGMLSAILGMRPKSHRITTGPKFWDEIEELGVTGRFFISNLYRKEMYHGRLAKYKDAKYAPPIERLANNALGKEFIDALEQVFGFKHYYDNFCAFYQACLDTKSKDPTRKKQSLKQIKELKDLERVFLKTIPKSEHRNKHWRLKPGYIASNMKPVPRFWQEEASLKTGKRFPIGVKGAVKHKVIISGFIRFYFEPESEAGIHIKDNLGKAPCVANLGEGGLAYVPLWTPSDTGFFPESSEAEGRPFSKSPFIERIRK